MHSESESVQSVLMEEFQRRVRVNPRYSLRAYSRALGMSSGALSEILRKQRPVSLKAAVRISKALGLNGAEAKHFYGLVEAEKRQSLGDLHSDIPTRTKKALDEDTFRLVSEWQHFAILNLLDCEGFRWNSSYISKRLGLSLSQAKLAMDLLLRLKLVKIEGTRALAIGDSVVFEGGIPSAAVRSFHRQMLEKGIEALELRSLEQREMNGVGFAVDPKKLPQIKRDISNFLDELVNKHSKGKRQEVYFLETALFQITHGERDEKE